MTRATPTAAQVRKHLKANGYEVRIRREDGKVTYRPDCDHHPGASPIWLDGGWLFDWADDIALDEREDGWLTDEARWERRRELLARTAVAHKRKRKEVA